MSDLYVYDYINDQNKKEVKELGERIGYGRIMQLCEELWREALMKNGQMKGGELTVGPCAVFLVPCPHKVRGKNRYCNICCGSGRITEGVAKLLKRRKK